MKSVVPLLPLFAALLAPAAIAAEQPVPVQQEPHHKTVFENDLLRVIDVQIPPGRVTLYHIHALPSVIVYLTKSANRSQTWGETTASPRETTPGESRYAPYDVKALTHQVTNPGPAPFRVLDIELLKPAGASPSAVIVRPNVQMRWEEKLVRSYTVTVEPGSQAEFPAANGGHLLIGISGSVTASADANAKRDLRNGDYAFYPAQSSFQLRNSGKEKAGLVLLELK